VLLFKSNLFAACDALLHVRLVTPVAPPQQAISAAGVGAEASVVERCAATQKLQGGRQAKTALQTNRNRMSVVYFE
jgi:hypothetical protein